MAVIQQGGRWVPQFQILVREEWVNTVLNDTSQLVAQGFWEGLRRSAAMIAERIRMMAPKRTGRLRRAVSWSILRHGMIHFYIKSSAPYGNAVDQGAEAHRIVPKAKRIRGRGRPKKDQSGNTLRFYVGGVAVFRKSVMKPAIKPSYFIKRGVEGSGQAIRLTVDEAIAARVAR